MKPTLKNQADNEARVGFNRPFPCRFVPWGLKKHNDAKNKNTHC